MTYQFAFLLLVSGTLGKPGPKPAPKPVPKPCHPGCENPNRMLGIQTRPYFDYGATFSEYQLWPASGNGQVNRMAAMNKMAPMHVLSRMNRVIPTNTIAGLNKMGSTPITIIALI